MIQYQESNSQGNYNCNAYYYDNISFPYHFHKNMELLYVLEGEVELRLESRAETIAAGQYALIFSNQIHAYHTGKASKSWVGVFSQDHVAEFSGQTEGLEGNPSGFLCPDSLQDYLRETLPLSFQEQGLPALYRRKSCLYAVCSQYLSCAPQLYAVNRGHDLPHRLLEIIAAEFTGDLTLAQLAGRLGYDYHYLSRYFHQLFHTNFRTFLNQYRFDYAVYLLTHTELSITEIALKSGFQSLRSFNRIFRDLSSMSPREYSDHRYRL